ncbi:E3 ubiquitin-protein ligase FANCL [Planoprotostelium fungivorum]|uniref:E3 ubiquitin-protein ligase FANCL n=1 Tax=Planoprotostelium fungivorum TaxID=1890364 RepID=A0A2P6NXE8_9EUKA|nr:E3 ubiquitin-protein ligase FANCL [Planoprotostelium fungivorum]
MNIAEIFPQLLQLDPEGHRWRGFVSIQGKDFLLAIELPNGPQNLKDAELSCGEELSTLLKGMEDKRLNQSKNLTSFLMELKDLVQGLLISEEEKTFKPPAEFYSRLMMEMDTIGWNRLVHIDKTLTNIQLNTYDSRNRNHIVQLTIPKNYPSYPPQVTFDLPKEFLPKWTPNTSGLKDVLKQVEEQYSHYEELWDSLDDLYENTWVLEPKQKNYSKSRCRIALGNHSSIEMEMDTIRPKNIPEVQFMGADQRIAPIRDHFNRNVHLWDNREKVRKNLEKTMGMHLPSRKDTKEEDMSEECGICYTYDLGTGRYNTPDRVCDNDKCGKELSVRVAEVHTIEPTVV